MKKMKAMRTTLESLLKKADGTAPPIDFLAYSAKHVIKFLLSLRSASKEREIVHIILQQQKVRIIPHV